MAYRNTLRVLVEEHVGVEHDHAPRYPPRAVHVPQHVVAASGGIPIPAIRELKADPRLAWDRRGSFGLAEFYSRSSALVLQYGQTIVDVGHVHQPVRRHVDVV